MKRISSKIDQIEKRRGKPIADLLIELYEKHGSQRAVADELGITQGTVSLWIMRAGLEPKTILVPKEQCA